MEEDVEGIKETKEIFQVESPSDQLVRGEKILPWRKICAFPLTKRILSKN
jgi:hypothetical protein